MRNREKPPSVLTAQRLGDHNALSRLGRLGAMRKKEFAERDRKEKEFLAELKNFRRLVGSRQMRFEANEHVCPVND